MRGLRKVIHSLRRPDAPALRVAAARRAATQDRDLLVPTGAKWRKEERMFLEILPRHDVQCRRVFRINMRLREHECGR